MIHPIRTFRNTVEAIQLTILNFQKLLLALRLAVETNTAATAAQLETAKATLAAAKDASTATAYLAARLKNTVENRQASAMIFKPIALEDIAAFLFQKKPKPEATVPTIRFDVPPLTPEQIAKSVSGTGGPWRSLQDVYKESIEEKRAKRLSDRYDMTLIPQAEWEEDL